MLTYPSQSPTPNQQKFWSEITQFNLAIDLDLGEIVRHAAVYRREHQKPIKGVLLHEDAFHYLRRQTPDFYERLKRCRLYAFPITDEWQGLFEIDLGEASYAFTSIVEENILKVVGGELNVQFCTAIQGVKKKTKATSPPQGQIYSGKTSTELLDALDAQLVPNTPDPQKPRRSKRKGELDRLLSDITVIQQTRKEEYKGVLLQGDHFLDLKLEFSDIFKRFGQAGFYVFGLSEVMQEALGTEIQYGAWLPRKDDFFAIQKKFVDWLEKSPEGIIAKYALCIDPNRLFGRQNAQWG